MYACLYARNNAVALLAVADLFSPFIERTASDTVVFSIAPLRKLIGSPHQIASEICHAGEAHKLQASLAIAADPDTAILLARYFPGVTLVTPGEERLRLAPIPLTHLFSHDSPINPALLSTLHRWGLSTCEDLASLPEKGVSERLGSDGVYLRNLALGTVHRPLHLAKGETEYREHIPLDHPLSNLEPLLFLFARALNDLCAKLHAQSQAARILKLQLQLENNAEFRRALEFPVPLNDAQSILKLLQLDLERHSPAAAVVAFTVSLEPANPRRVQGGLFLPPSPPPDKLQLTLARIAGLVGKENVGTPALLNTHRPDAFTLRQLPEMEARPDEESNPPGGEILRLAMRLFRPALVARVTLAGANPKHVLASGVSGRVLEAAGPWKTSGEWWTSTAWIREEWDVALDDGALYRIYLQPNDHAWFVAGIYD